MSNENEIYFNNDSDSDKVSIHSIVSENSI